MQLHLRVQSLSVTIQNMSTEQEQRQYNALHAIERLLQAVQQPRMLIIDADAEENGSVETDSSTSKPGAATPKSTSSNSSSIKITMSQKEACPT